MVPQTHCKLCYSGSEAPDSVEADNGKATVARYCIAGGAIGCALCTQPRSAMLSCSAASGHGGGYRDRLAMAINRQRLRRLRDMCKIADALSVQPYAGLREG